MHNIAAADSIFEFFPKPVQRLCGIAHTGFHFNGIDFIFRFAVVGDNEVNLNVVSFFFFIVLRIEKQPMPIGSKHLRNGILKQHAFVDSKLPSKNLFID